MGGRKSKPSDQRKRDEEDQSKEPGRHAAAGMDEREKQVPEVKVAIEIESGGEGSAANPPANIEPAEKTSLDLVMLYARALSDTPYFTIEVRAVVRSPLVYTFLDTSEQKMLYDPIVNRGSPSNLSLIWAIKPPSTGAKTFRREIGSGPSTDETDEPLPSGEYTFSNFVTPDSHLRTGLQISTTSAFTLQVLPSSQDQVFTLDFNTRSRLYAISMMVDGGRAYLLPPENIGPPRSNVINAVVPPGRDGGTGDFFIFRIRSTDISYTITGIPRLTWK